MDKDRDFLRIVANPALASFFRGSKLNHISHHLAAVCCSVQVEIRVMLMFNKKRSVVLTPEKIYIFNKSDTQPRYIHDYSDVLGLTLSLLVGAKNMILHFAT